MNFVGDTPVHNNDHIFYHQVENNKKHHLSKVFASVVK